LGFNPFTDPGCTWGDPPRAGEPDPYRFLEPAIEQSMRADIALSPIEAIPFAPVEKPLAESRVSIVSTAGLSMRGDTPFDLETEKKRPSWGDPSWRRLRSDVTAETIQAHHLHIDTKYLFEDLDVCFPVPLLHEFASEGRVGEVAPSHYSIMGFQGPDLRRLRKTSPKPIAEAMQSEEVDLAIFVPV
jgi:D-proline reductase (dithiol) PrdB